MKKEDVKDLFVKIDKEDDGAIYLKDIVLYLRAMNEDIDKNLEVKVLLDQYDTNGDDQVGLGQFSEIIGELEEAGWKKAKPKKVKEINQFDIKAIFNLVDVDRSGSVSRTEARMAARLLKKRFQIDNVKDWLKENDQNEDGRLSFKEFYKSLKKVLKLKIEDLDDDDDLSDDEEDNEEKV